MNIEKKQAVLYCRVSTKEQVEEGNSLATQERNCREYAHKHGYEVAQVFIEEGESAKTADRTELQKLLVFCRDRGRQISAVLVYKIDRLSRNTDDYSQLRILLRRYGVEIKSTSEHFENTPAGRFMENIIANVAQFDNDVRTERCVGGMKDAVRQGRYVWMAPVGYVNQKVDGKANIVPSDKAYMVRMAFDLVAEGKQSLVSIRETLASMGLPLSKPYFYNILKNKLYTGWIYKFGEWNKGAFEPLISERLFDRVQQMLRRKRPVLLYRRENPDFPLRRFIFWPDGSKITGAWAAGRRKKYAYYRFMRARQEWPKFDLESKFMALLDQYSFPARLLETLKKEVFNRFSVLSETNKAMRQDLEGKRARLKERQHVLIQKNIDGIIADELLREQLAATEEELWSIDQVLQKSEGKTTDISHVLDFVSDFLRAPSLFWEKASFELKVKLQWFVFPQGIVYENGKLRTTVVSCIFKLKELFPQVLSSLVDYPQQDFEHEDFAILSTLHNDKNIAWENIQKDLLSLQEVLSDLNA